ncbi:MAG: UDP-N-acetylmuramate dehydrogenase [Patescibacteria group bacterium]
MDGIKFRENVNLSRLNNYGIGGPARFFSEVSDASEAEKAIRLAKEKGLRIFILGGGTNLLVADEGFDGLVLKPNIKFLEAHGNTVKAGAGVSVAELLDFSAERGLSGLEWAGGLPGTVGGAVRGNAGAFGGEFKDSIVEVDSFDIGKMNIVKRSGEECGFGYRNSVFKEDNGEIILSALISMKNGDPEDSRRAIREKIDYRLLRHPMEYPNIGSIFKNVSLDKISPELRDLLGNVVKTDPFPVVPTAYLISETGLKGVSCGGAMISPKHPNFIVNTLNASASDVESLISLVKFEVNKKFGIDLEEEVMRVN